MSEHETFNVHDHACVHGPERPGRRSFLGAAAATVGAFAAMPFGQLTDVSKRALAAGAAGEARLAQAGASKKARVVLLGTSGGPPPVAGSTGIATAVVAGDGVYLVDCGRSAVTQFMNAGLDLAKIKGVFVTHTHIDHVIDLFSFFALGATITPTTGVPGINLPIPVYGPGRAPATAFLRPVTNPIAAANPIPGTADLMQLGADAMAYQLNQVKLLNGPDVRDLIKVSEIPVPAGVPATSAPIPTNLQPFPLFEDANVKVSATMVPHVYASFGFRFDTDDGSFVISGDTGKSDNLILLSKDADVLVHEVVDLDKAIEAKILGEELRMLFLRGHTDVLEVGGIAQAAGVKTLVVDHFIPSAPGLVTQARWRKQAKKGYDGNVVVGRDLMQITADGKVVKT